MMKANQCSEVVIHGCTKIGIRQEWRVDLGWGLGYHHWMGSGSSGETKTEEINICQELHAIVVTRKMLSNKEENNGIQLKQP